MKNKLAEAATVILFVVIFATLTLPFLKLSGILDLLGDISVYCAKNFLLYFGWH